MKSEEQKPFKNHEKNLAEHDEITEFCPKPSVALNDTRNHNEERINQLRLELEYATHKDLDKTSGEKDASESFIVREWQVELRNKNGQLVNVHCYQVKKERLFPAFGIALLNENSNTVCVRDDLPERVKKFVIDHELYHITDPYKWGGVFGRELRANLVPGIKNLLGLLQTVWMTITNKERMSLYLDRFKRRY